MRLLQTCLSFAVCGLRLCAGICSVWIGVYYVKYRWRKDEEETRQMYDMVESIVGKMIFSSLFYTKMELKTKRITIQPVLL